MPDTPSRKEDHLALFRRTHPTHGSKTTLLEEVELIPDPLPQLSLHAVDPSVELLGRRLAAPLVITGMTGGTDEAGAINRTLATLAAERGLGFGVGSQRAMLEDPELAWTYAVRDVLGPDGLLLANVGVGQLAELETDRARWLVESIGADALVVHLNVAQELVQAEGDRDFSGTADALARLAAGLECPLLVKEVGAGIDRAGAERLRDLGITALDVAGAGGTSWTWAEGLRGDPRARRLGETFRAWGLPTAAAVLQVAGCGLPVLASGGIRTGLDVARALALGATACGMAGAVVRALGSEGETAARRLLGLVVEELRVTLVLTGCRRAGDLAHVRRVLGPALRRWRDT